MLSCQSLRWCYHSWTNMFVTYFYKTPHRQAYVSFNKYDIFQDKSKYSMLDTSCQRLWICISKILLSHIHKNTVMSDEHIVSVQSCMQFLPTLMRVILLQRVEEQLLPLREVMLCSCVQTKNYIILFWGFVWLKEHNVFQESYATLHFLWSQILRMISYIHIVECTSLF